MECCSSEKPLSDSGISARTAGDPCHQDEGAKTIIREDIQDSWNRDGGALRDKLGGDECLANPGPGLMLRVKVEGKLHYGR